VHLKIKNKKLICLRFENANIIFFKKNTVPNDSFCAIWFKISLSVYEIAIPNTPLVY